MWYCSDVCFSDLNTTFDPCTEQYHTNLFGKFIYDCIHMLMFGLFMFSDLQTYGEGINWTGILRDRGSSQ